jgi:hypothetical protein
LPLSSRIFTVAPLSKKEAFNLLKDYKRERTAKLNGETVKLITAINECHDSDDDIRGELEHDFLSEVVFRGQTRQIPQTITRRFSLKVGSASEGHLVVFETGQGMIADRMNRILFGATEGIVDGRIPLKKIGEFLDQNAEEEYWEWWKDLDIPHLTKAALKGPNLARATMDYQRYNRHGKRYYAIIKLKKRGWVISISESAIVMLFSTSLGDEEDFLRFLKSDIIPIVH